MKKIILELDENVNVEELGCALEKALDNISDSGTIAGYDKTPMGYKLHLNFTEEDEESSYMAKIKNITLDKWVKTEDNGAVTYTEDETEALEFYEEEDAESTLEYLNDTFADAFVLLVGKNSDQN